MQSLNTPRLHPNVICIIYPCFHTSSYGKPLFYANAISTFATKPSGEVAHFRLASNSAVKQVKANALSKVVVDGRTIRISDSTPFSVFSASGICIAGNVSHYSCPTTGMYIVKTATGFVKVNVK